MGSGPTIRKANLDAPKVLDRPPSGFAAGIVTPIFTVVRGLILMIALTGRVTVQIAAGGNTIRTAAPGAVNMDDNTCSINGMAVGTNLLVPGSVIVAISVVPAVAYFANLPWNCVVGNFTCTCTATTGTGRIRWSLAYLPVTEDALVLVA